MTQISVPPYVVDKAVTFAQAVMLAGVLYIARTLRSMSSDVGRLTRAYYGEDGAQGAGQKIEVHEKHLARLDRRVDRIETSLGIDERKADQS